MRIRILVSLVENDNGITRSYGKNNVVDMPEGRAKALIKAGHAEQVIDEVVEMENPEQRFQPREKRFDKSKK